MSDVKEEQVANQQAAMDQQGTSDYLNHVLGGINDSESPALNELRGKVSDPSNFQPPVEDVKKEDNGLLNSGLNTQGTPEKNPEAPVVNENELVNDLNENLEGAGPEIVLDNPLMQIKAVKENVNTDSPLSSIEGIDKVNEFISSKVEGVKSIDDFISKYTELQNQYTETSKYKGDYDGLINGLKSLPPDLIEAIRLSESGEDYRSYVSSVPSLDFNKEAATIDAKDLIKAYYGNKVSDADFEAADRDSDDYDPNVERYVNSLKENAIEKFNRDKSDFNAKTESYLNSKNEKKASYQASVKQSLSSIKQFFPDATESYVQSVEDKLLKEGIDSLFKDESGNFKPDAAARFVRASDDGANLITQLQQIAYDKAKTEANLDILTRSQRTSPNSGGTAQKQDVNQEKVNDYIQKLVGGVNQSSNY